MNTFSIPVLMFHSVANHGKHRPWSFLSMPVQTFELCIKHLYLNGFKTITLNQLYEYMNGNIDLPNKSIILTFDDGFLDNWVYAYPILKKYGMKGTIFVSPEFVDMTDEYRPNLEDIRSGYIPQNDLEYWGYLSWNEMIKMEKEGDK